MAGRGSLCLRLLLSQPGPAFTLLPPTHTSGATDPGQLYSVGDLKQVVDYVADVEELLAAAL